MAFLLAPAILPRPHTLAPTPLPASRRPASALPRRARLFPTAPTTPATTMSAIAGAGISSLPDTASALHAALDSALASLPASTPPSVALLSATVDRDLDTLLATARARLGHAVPIHGLTTCAAILSPAAGPTPNAVGVLLLAAPPPPSSSSSSSPAPPAPAYLTAAAVAPADAAAALKAKLPAAAELCGVLMFTHPGGEEAALRALDAALPGVPVYGGTAADNEITGAWRVISSDAGVMAEGVSLLAVVKDAGVKFAGAIVGPYTPHPEGLSAEITGAEGRTVKTLDGRPAADVLVEWMGEEVLGEARREGGLVLPQTSTRPVAVKAGDDAEGKPYYVSIHAAAISAEEGSVDLFTEVTTGDRLYLMAQEGADAADSAERGLVQSYREAMAKGSMTKPQAGVMIYCGGMAIAVGDKLGQSITGEFAKSVDLEMPLIGMTCFGEQTCQPGIGSVQRNLSVGVCLFE